MDGLFADARPIGDLKLLAAGFVGSKPETLRTLCDEVKSRNAKAIAILTSTSDGKGTICVACGADAVAAGAHAGKIVKALCSLTGGSGGGRPDSAMGSAKDIFRIDEAMAQAPDVILAMLK